MSILIAPAHACGLGIMAADLAAHCEPITHVVAVESMPNAPRVVWPTRVSVEVVQRGSQPKTVHGSTVVFIEASLDVDISGFERRVFVPMWENINTGYEAKSATCIISVTKYGHEKLAANGILSGYLPWPVELKSLRSTKKVKTLLHVAGSFGHWYRKGTPEAVGMWNASGLADKGVRLVIRCWEPMPQEIKELIAGGSGGIEVRDGFVAGRDELFEDADALLMPSRCEGHAVVALEAMARGIPCFVTNAAPINEYETSHRFLLPIIGMANLTGSPFDYAICDTARSGELLRGMVLDSANWIAAASVRAYLTAERMSWGSLGEEWGKTVA